MTKAERKLLQEKEAELFLEKEQYIDWFGKESSVAKMAIGSWLAVYEILELLDVEVDHDLPENIEGMERQRERIVREEQEKINQ
jgi:hypothetical protein